METESYIERFEHMLACKYAVSLWCYTEELNLLSSNCPNAQWWDRMFDLGTVKASMRAHFRNSEMPLIMGSGLGLLCGAVYAPAEKRFYVLGPVMTNESSVDALAEQIRRETMEFGRNSPDSFTYRKNMTEAVQMLPTISMGEFSGDVVMLHCCVTGEQIHYSDLVWLDRPADMPESTFDPKRDRHRVWVTSQALFRMVEDGNLDYNSILGKAALVSNGVRVSCKEPLRQAKLSCQVFTAKCIDASVRGGLNPEVAYSLGNSFMQQMEDAKSITEISALNHRMYDAFIQRVHRERTRPDLSKTVRDCLDYIELHTEEKLSVAVLADYAGYSENYLNGRFKKETGSTINEYIKIMRIERAKLLLVFTDLSIEEISKRLQYASRGYFSEVFKGIVGVTPPVYRKEHKI